MKIKLSPILKKGKAIYLAYDQGFEHGPIDFNDKNIDPDYIFNIALKGKYNGIIVHKGIAEKYYTKKYKKIPLIVKLNGKTKLLKGEPLSTQLCTVNEAKKLGAKAVGYTIYVGSAYSQKMFQEFENIQREAHKIGIPVIAWMYPRGKAVKKPQSREIQAYAARLGLELGADMIKMHISNNMKDFKWLVKSAGKVKVFVAGGPKASTNKLLENTYNYMKNGAYGIAIGRNIWQYKEPLKITKALKEIIFNNKTPKQAMKYLK
ncbi:MAG: fructose-bisphosphate aldolase [Candidatus Woesearchaeota archaeon]